jgi:hypothetical protein
MSGEQRSTEKIMVSDPAFQLDAPMAIDESLIRDELVEITADGGSLGANVNGKGEIILEQIDKDNWYEWHKAFLYGRVRIRKADGTAIDERAALMSGATALISQANLLINETSVEQKDHVAVGAWIRKLVQASVDGLKTVDTNALYYLDTGAGGISVTPLTTSQADATNITAAMLKAATFNTDYNEGFDKKSARARDGDDSDKYMHFVLPLKDLFGFCRDVQIALRGQSVKVVLQMNSNMNTMLHTTAATDCKIELGYLSMFVPQLKPSLSEQGRLLSLMQEKFKTAVRYRSWQCYALAVNTSDIDQHINTASSKAKPVHAWAAFQLDTQYGAMAGAVNSIAGNTSVFSTRGGIERAHVKVNDQQFPRRDYQPLANGYAREYSEFIRSSGKDSASTDSVVGGAMTFEQSKSLYPILAFDLSKRDIDVYSDASEARVSFTGRTALASTGRLYIVLEHEREVVFESTGKDLAIRV